MELPLPVPRSLADLARGTAGVADLARSAAGRAVEAAAAVVTVPVRLLRVLGAVELLVNRITVTADRADALLARTGNVVGEAEESVRQIRVIATAAALVVEEAATVATGAAATVATAEGVATAAAGVVDRAAGAAAEADALLATYGPTLRQAAPMAQRFVQQLTPEEVTAAIRLVDELPQLREHLPASVLPLLGTLDRVGPDVHALLEVTRDLKLAVAGIPGMRMLRRRGEDRLADEEIS